MKSYITRTVLILSFVSLFTDIASEMLYPIFPIYLQSIGFSIVLIGILEGVAEAVAGLSKGYFGKLSDTLQKRIPFVRYGYGMSALSKPMLAVFSFPLWIFLSRTIDRLGKGIRTGARDALLSAESKPETKGRVFGFHRGLDTLGAAIGPLFALAFLFYSPGNYRLLFLVAAIPGVLAIALTFLVRDKTTNTNQASGKVRFFDFLKYWKTSPVLYRKLTVGLLVFTLVNSSDVFLLLKVKDSGVDDTIVIGIYILYNFVYAIAAFPVGIIADKVGLKKVFIAGLLIFAVVYAGMAVSNNFNYFVLFFVLYALYASATEGVSKAWITNICEAKDAATAIGTFSAFQSICTMIASSITGIVWYQFGAATAFLTTATMTLGVAVYLLSVNFNTQ